MAPEQINPEMFEEGVSERPTVYSDIFSFGCVCIEVCRRCFIASNHHVLTLYQLYTAHAPYAGMTDLRVMSGVLYGQRPARTTIIDDVEVTIPLELWRIAEKCWAYEPQRRAPIEELLQDMTDLQIPWVSTLGGPIVISRTFTQLTSGQN